jgi:hypothetical protein
MENTTAIVQTGSNYKNCNGKPLKVVELKGTRVTCEIPFYGFDKEGKAIGDKIIHSDFILNEVIRFN